MSSRDPASLICAWEAGVSGPFAHPLSPAHMPSATALTPWRPPGPSPSLESVVPGSLKLALCGQSVGRGHTGRGGDERRALARDSKLGCQEAGGWAEVSLRVARAALWRGGAT